MADEIKTGDTVEITIKGRVQSRAPEYANTMRILTDSGNSHYVYLGHAHSSVTPMIRDGETRYGVTVKKVESLEAGKAYIDADGDTLIRTSTGGWLTVNGHFKANDWASRPLRKLVPES